MSRSKKAKRLGRMMDPLIVNLRESVSSDLLEVVRKEGSQYFVFSKDGRKLSKGFDSEAEAKKRLGEIEKFKKKANESAQFKGRFYESKPIDAEGWVWEAVMIEVGFSKNEVMDEATGEKKRRRYTEEALKKGVADGIFEGVVAVCVEKLDPINNFDHLPENIDVNRLPRNTCGVFHKARFEDGVGSEGGVVARYVFVDDDLRKRNMKCFEETGSPLFAFSINGSGKGDFTHESFEVELVTEMKSVDPVSRPAAGGRFMKLVASMGLQEGETMDFNALLYAFIKDNQPDLIEGLDEATFKVKCTENLQMVLDMLGKIKAVPEMSKHANQIDALITAAKAAYPTPTPTPTPTPGPTPTPVQAAGHTDDNQGTLSVKEEDGKWFVMKDGTKVAGPFDSEEAARTALKARSEKKAEGLSKDEVNTMIDENNKKAEVDRIVASARESFKKDEHKDLLTSLTESRPTDVAHAKKQVDRVKKIAESGGWDDPKLTENVKVGNEKGDRLLAAVEASVKGRSILLESKGAGDKSGTKETIAPFSSLTGALHEATGVYDETGDAVWRLGAAVMAGVAALDNPIARKKGLTKRNMDSLKEAVARSHSARMGVSMRESITLATFANAWADKINRELLEDPEFAYLDDFKEIVTMEKGVKDFETQNVIQRGQYGTVAAVGEGGTYNPISTPNDRNIPWTVEKFGNTEDWTWEAALRDDVGALVDIPFRLKRAARLTRYLDFFDMLLLNEAIAGGSGVLFSGANANTSSNTFSISGMKSMRTSMRRQRPFGSTQLRLSMQNVPALVFGPPDLEEDFLELFGSSTKPETDLPAGVFNLFKGVRHIILPEETDVDRWFGIASKTKKIPLAAWGYIRGFAEPVLFQNDNPNVGPMFDEDKSKLKVKATWAKAILDHRGFFRNQP